MTTPAGRVEAVNVSRGGVPKLPVERAWVSRLGVEGDGHNEPTQHGGPHRAVCLFGVEAIARLQAEGHPVAPGSVGENLTTSGIEWSLLQVGTRARVGDQLELEVASSTTPCETQRHNFSDGRFSRISIELHPSDSRMYARVLTEGEVRPGDPVILLPPIDTRAADQLLHARFERTWAKASLLMWRSAIDAGAQVHIVDDGELVMAAALSMPGPAFNRAFGMTSLPQLVSRVTDFFDRHQITGVLLCADAPWPDATPKLEFSVYAAAPQGLVEGGLPAGVEIHRIAPGEAEAGTRIYLAGGAQGTDDDASAPWSQIRAAMAAAPHHTTLLATLDGAPAGVASLHVYRHTGLLMSTVVTPEARGRGIQRALIAARARLALERGCDILVATTEPDTASTRNVLRLGFRQIGWSRAYVYQPRPA